MSDQIKIYNDILKDSSAEIPSSNTGAMKVKSEPFRALSIDWLSVSCKVIREPKQFFQIEHASYGNSIWFTIRIFKVNNMPFFTVFSNPKSSILPNDSAILKFENWILYSDQFKFNALQLIDDAGLSYTKINRADIALDIQNFDHNLNPHTLITMIVNEKVNRLGKGKFTLIGRSHKQLRYDYLRFGTKNSPVSVYLYNKSQEFRDVAVKQHIVKNWELIGYNQNKDVWRLEISIVGNVKQLYDNSSGELLYITIYTLLDSYYLRCIYYSLFLRYFSFKYVDKTKHHSNWKPVKLLSNSKDYALSVSDIEHVPNATRIHKIVIGKMIDFYDTAQFTSKQERINYYNSIITYTTRYQLTNWAIQIKGLQHHSQKEL